MMAQRLIVLRALLMEIKAHCMIRAAMAGKAPKAWALPRFWVSIRSYKKQLVKEIWSRILGLSAIIQTV